MHRGTLAERAATSAERASRPYWRCEKCGSGTASPGDGRCIAYDFDTEMTCYGLLVADEPSSVEKLRCAGCGAWCIGLTGPKCADCIAKEAGVALTVEEMSGDELWPLLELDLGGEG